MLVNWGWWSAQASAGRERVLERDVGAFVRFDLVVDLGAKRERADPAPPPLLRGGDRGRCADVGGGCHE